MVGMLGEDVGMGRQTGGGGGGERGRCNKGGDK